MTGEWAGCSRPLLPVTLKEPGSTVESLALVDSGADVNVLPWSLGLRPGLAWNPNKATLRVLGITGHTSN